MTENIKYESENIEAFYKTHRIRWTDFYESERVVFEKLKINSETKILDIGCGCAGLGLALKERFGVKDYTGVEINDKAAETAKILYPESKILTGDFVEISEHLVKNTYDLVISLSGIDWNIEFEKMFAQAYNFVKEGGYFLYSCRLTDQKTMNDIQKSYQFIDFDGKKEGERAAYVVLNFEEQFKKMKQMKPAQIMGYGYWGKPSATAVTPYEKVCFAVIAIRKPELSDAKKLDVQLDLPEDILKVIQKV